MNRYLCCYLDITKEHIIIKQTLQDFKKMNLIVSKKFILITFFANFCWGGIEVPRNECVWLNGHYGNEIKCDGNQVVVGACG